MLAHSVRDLDVDRRAHRGDEAARRRPHSDADARGARCTCTRARPRSSRIRSSCAACSLFSEHIDIVSAPAFQERVRNDKVAQSIKQALVQAKKNLKIMSDAGIPIGFGTDGGVPNNMTFGRFQGYLEHMELELMVEAGLTPMQALTAATSGVGADHRGSIRSARSRPARRPTCSSSTRIRFRTSAIPGRSTRSGSADGGSRRLERTRKPESRSRLKSQARSEVKDRSRFLPALSL